MGRRVTTIALVGPDGSGKSTLANHLDELAQAAGHKVLRRHWAPGILPRPGRIIGRPARPTDQPHDVQVHGRLITLILLIWFWVDFVVGDIVVWLTKRRDSTILLAERGWEDVAVDPRRYRMTAMPRLVALLGNRLGKPDLLVVLSAGAAADERDTGLSLDEHRRQDGAWRTCSHRHPHVLRFESDEQTPDVIAAAVMAAIGPSPSELPTWRALPTRSRADFVFQPQDLGASRARGLHIPCTKRARLVLAVSSVVARSPARRLAPASAAPPEVLQQAVSFEGCTSVVARFASQETWIVAGGTAEGLLRVAKFAKIEEVHNIVFAARVLGGGSLRPPEVIDTGAGVVLCTRFETPARRSPELTPPSEAADELGRLWSESDRGFVHGDFAPWNLLETERGLVLLDWEHGFEGAPPLYDLWHWLVQCHLLLGTAAPLERMAEPAISRAFSSFRTSAAIGPCDPTAFYREYLDTSLARFSVPQSRAESDRQRLLDQIR